MRYQARRSAKHRETRANLHPMKSRKQVEGKVGRTESWQLPQGSYEIYDLNMYFHREQYHIWSPPLNFSQH